MKFTKEEIGIQLKNELAKGYNVERISNWAYDLFISLRSGESSSEVDFILDRISVMGAGPEFEYDQDELKLLAQKLIDNEKDPIKQIDALKFKA